MDIHLDDVTKHFPTTRALHEVSLNLVSGSHVGLIGPNGSGKTTLLQAIVGLIDVEGEVSTGGHSPFEERSELAPRIAYVPQIAPEFDVVVHRLVETICRARQISTDDVETITGHLGLSLADHTDKAYRSLSGGMKQKLLIALACADPPDLLVMDEPTASLDADSRARFFEICEDVFADATVLLCSHRLDEIRHLVDSIIALLDGEVAADGPLDEFVGDMGRVSIEIRLAENAEDALAESTLRELGLKPVGNRRWSGFIDWRDKMPTVRQLLDSGRQAIDDLVVNDMRELDV